MTRVDIIVDLPTSKGLQTVIGIRFNMARPIIDDEEYYYDSIVILAPYTEAADGNGNLLFEPVLYESENGNLIMEVTDGLLEEDTSHLEEPRIWLSENNNIITQVSDDSDDSYF